MHSIGTSNSRGVSILIHSSVGHKVLNTQRDTNGRLILVNVMIDTVTYSLVNIYAPNNQGDRNIFFKHLSEVITEYAEGTIILCGAIEEIARIRKYLREQKPVTLWATYLKKRG